MNNILIIGIICIILIAMLYFTSIQNLAKGTSRDKSKQKESVSASTNLLSKSEYEKMIKEVDKVCKTHRTDQSVAVNLTSGPFSKEAAYELHHLLPGNNINLQKCNVGGLSFVEVYSRGFLIGRLMLDDAEVAINIMQTSAITGVYVAEQNCFGDCKEVSLKLIIFHSPARRINPSGLHDNPYKITYQGKKPFTLFQN